MIGRNNNILSRPGNFYSRTPHPEDMPAKMGGDEGPGRSLPHNQGLYVQRRIVIKRDATGYGLTVTGDNPVYVQSVREDGAAAKAGVKKGDRIIKVNGTLVSSCHHQHVVKLIKEEPVVSLTLQTLSHIPPSCHSTSERIITAPQPVDPQKQQEMNTTRFRTIRKMYDQERIFVENLRAELLKSPSDKLQAEFVNASRRLVEIQKQLSAINLDPTAAGPKTRLDFLSRESSIFKPKLAGENKLCRESIVQRHLSLSLENLASKTWKPCKSHHSRQRSHPESLHWEERPLPRSKSETSTLEDGPRRSAALSSRGSSFGQSDISQPPTPPRNESPTPNYPMEGRPLPPIPSAPMMSFDGEEEPPDIGEEQDHGRFSAIWRLARSPPHVAVFCHYLVANQESASLLFYLITFWYKQNGGKEMKRWSYELYSTFVVPGAPLRVPNIDDAILNEIDNILQQPPEKEEVFRGIFQHARKKAELYLTRQLAEFRSKRAKGLGNLYGPPDYQLEEAVSNPSKESKIVESQLLPILSTLPHDETEKVDDVSYAVAVSLATVLKQYGVKIPQVAGMDKYPTFLAKEKSWLRLRQKNKKVSLQVHGHNFVPQQFTTVTFCNHCQLLIWGPAPQGFLCQECEMHIHKGCGKVVEENCIGSFRPVKRDRRQVRMSGLMENFISKSRRSSDRLRRSQDEGFDSMENMEATDSTRPEDDTPLLPSAPSPAAPPELAEALTNGKQKAMGRSESFRQRRENRPSFRKRSDPSIPRSKSDVEADSKPAFLGTPPGGGSSSNSSLSTRSDEQPPDSDLDAEPDPPSWEDSMDFSQLPSPPSHREKKRQNIINEFFHTERSHVRTLKVLERLFRAPLSQEPGLVPPDLLQLLFPNLGELLALHGRFNSAMKALRQAHGPLVGEVGELLLDMFDGENGAKLQTAAAQFCRHHSIALDTLKSRQKKDVRLAQFLMDAETHPLCRRLHLSDLLPAQFQRLVKYPLLLDSLAQYSPPASQEQERVAHAAERAKAVLAFVDQAVGEAADFIKLVDLQRRLDRAAAAETDPLVQAFYAELDLKQHRLIHEGPLTWRTSRQRSVELRAVLLADRLVLLQKLDDQRITLLTTPPVPNLPPRSPVLPVSEVFTRSVATDHKAFFLISTSKQQSAMYELVATTINERKTWQRHLAHAAEAAKPPSQECGPVAASTVTTGELIQPGQVTVVEAVTTETATLFSRTLDQLRQKEAEVQQALLEKQRLVAALLQLEPPAAPSQSPGPCTLNQLLLASMTQVDELARFVNEALSLDDSADGVARPLADLHMTSQLRSIAASLNSHFSHLLDVLSSQSPGGRPDSFLSLLSDDSVTAPPDEEEEGEIYVDASAATTNLDDAAYF